MLRVRTTLIALSSLVALAACGSDGGGSDVVAYDTGSETSDGTVNDSAGSDTAEGSDVTDAGEADTSETDTSEADTGGSSVTVPNDYPQLGAGEGIKVALTLTTGTYDLVTDDSLSRGYLPTYGIVVDEASGSRELTVFGLWSLDVGEYSYSGLDVGLEEGSDLYLSASCEDTLPTLEIVGGSAPGVVWGTLEAKLCKPGGSDFVLISARFTADAHESIEPDAGSCMGSSYCDFSATGDFSCTNDAPGCVWKPSICLGASDHPECRDWDGLSKDLCESNSGCVYFDSNCEGDVVIPCDTLDTEFGCETINGCFWLAD